MLCSKGLIAIIKQAIQEDIIKGLSLYKSVLKISHLLFADDSLLFCCAQMGHIQSIHGILD